MKTTHRYIIVFIIIMFTFLYVGENYFEEKNFSPIYFNYIAIFLRMYIALQCSSIVARSLSLCVSAGLFDEFGVMNFFKKYKYSLTELYDSVLVRVIFFVLFFPTFFNFFVMRRYGYFLIPIFNSAIKYI